MNALIHGYTITLKDGYTKLFFRTNTMLVKSYLDRLAKDVAGGLSVTRWVYAVDGRLVAEDVTRDVEDYVFSLLANLAAA